MTYSINWPITVRSAVPFCSIPEIISCRPGQHVEKPDTLYVFPSTVWEPKIEGLDLYTHYTDRSVCLCPVRAEIFNRTSGPKTGQSGSNRRPNNLPLLLVTWCKTKYYSNHQY